MVEPGPAVQEEADVRSISPLIRRVSLTIPQYGTLTVSGFRKRFNAMLILLRNYLLGMVRTRSISWSTCHNVVFGIVLLIRGMWLLRFRHVRSRRCLGFLGSGIDTNRYFSTGGSKP